jgi:hypothetical protein
MSTVTGKTISFNIYVGHALSHHDAATKDHVEPLENSVLLLSENLGGVEDAQNYMMGRALIAESTAGSTSSRVFWWSTFEWLLLVGMGIFQILYLRNYMEKTRQF